MKPANGSIFHLSSVEGLRRSRDEVLRFAGYRVVSTISVEGAAQEVADGDFDLVLIDIESQGGVAGAKTLCDEIKRRVPQQHVVYVCSHFVYVDTPCPNEVIRIEFNPEEFLREVKQAVADAKRIDPDSLS